MSTGHVTLVMRPLRRPKWDGMVVFGEDVVVGTLQRDEWSVDIDG